jgi:hypothetical protein
MRPLRMAEPLISLVFAVLRPASGLPGKALTVDVYRLTTS